LIGNETKRFYNQPISSAHLRYLKTLYPKIPNVNYYNPDKLTKVWYESYLTANVRDD